MENDLSAIDVDADDYAEAAAGDTPPTPRTFQSEAAFRAQKAAYTAKISDGHTYAELLQHVPALAPGAATFTSERDKIRLGKKDVQLLGYAVGELYYDREYARVVALCARVAAVCEVEGKLAESLERWGERCRARLGETG